MISLYNNSTPCSASASRLYDQVLSPHLLLHTSACLKLVNFDLHQVVSTCLDRQETDVAQITLLTCMCSCLPVQLVIVILLRNLDSNHTEL